MNMKGIKSFSARLLGNDEEPSPPSTTTTSTKPQSSSSSSSKSKELPDAMVRKEQFAWDDDDSAEKGKPMPFRYSRLSGSPRNSRAASNLLDNDYEIDKPREITPERGIKQTITSSFRPPRGSAPPSSAFRSVTLVSPGNNVSKLLEESKSSFDSSTKLGSSFGTVSESGNKHRKSKIEKIKELLDENRMLKDTLHQMNAGHACLSAEGTQEEKPPEKHLQALNALMSITKKQTDTLSAYQEKYEEVAQECEHYYDECRRVKKELSKKNKEVTMLEKQIDANLLEITGLRKEVAHSAMQIDALENRHKHDRSMLMDMTRDLALANAGRSDTSEDAKTVADKIQIFDEEISVRDREISDQTLKLANQKEQIQQLYLDLERTQDQVEKYERERDSTVHDMETYYEALKHELEEKNRLIALAKNEAQNIEIETSERIRVLEHRCEALNNELTGARVNLTTQRQENESSTSPDEFEEERERLNLELRVANEELDEIRQRYTNMEIENAKAFQGLEEELGELRMELTDARAAFRESNVRSAAMAETMAMLKTENLSLLEISSGLTLQLRDEQAKSERLGSAQEEKQLATIKTSADSFFTDERYRALSRSSGLDAVREDKDQQHRESDNVVDRSIGAGDGAVGASPNSSESDSPDDSLSQMSSSHQAPRSESPSTDQQALLLHAAAARKMQRESEKGTSKSWRSSIMNLGAQAGSTMSHGSSSKSLPPLPVSIAGENSEADSITLESAVKDELIDRLQQQNKEYEETISKLKSELVRMNSIYKDTVYLSKKKVDSLTQENAAYEIKLTVLEKMLEAHGDPADDLTEELSKASDQDRIKELEEVVSSLERQKNAANSKAKAVETDLESFQRMSKKASLDSLREIERLKKENEEKTRQLAAMRNGEDADDEKSANVEQV